MIIAKRMKKKPTN